MHADQGENGPEPADDGSAAEPPAPREAAPVDAAGPERVQTGPSEIEPPTTDRTETEPGDTEAGQAESAAPASFVDDLRAGQARQAGPQGQFPRRERPLPMHPRRVRQGVKLLKEPPSGPSAWAGERWRRLVEALGKGDAAAEGLEYAKLGQTKRLDIDDGVVRAPVQGRLPRAYQVTIEIRRLDSQQREGLIRAMADQAMFAAKLLSGELPRDIDALLAPLNTQLIPSDAGELVSSCTCKEEGEWCKHLVCVMHLVADRLSEDPFMAFRLRGFEPDDLLERLRQSRAVASAGGGATPVYTPIVADSGPATPLEDLAETFWTTDGPSVSLPIERPEVTHPLLRRLGPSPFEGRRFPLVGLLATCYDVISARAIGGEEIVEDGAEDEAGDARAATESQPQKAAESESDTGSEQDTAAEDGQGGVSEASLGEPAKPVVPPALRPKLIRGAKAKAKKPGG